ncbi:hypothetical protein AruPA_19995 [Acidiphilium sp. PA]|uniref:hypothetical protein n=1 Tax=Acidiphilium sp. PA TaxID=2871705 RepID=UPI0022447D46|nr:hypothetical protein [Acidiphilium sp. PA]MCW8309310.1 hypothetical protein [Acidiphilium sp. PA]
MEPLSVDRSAIDRADRIPVFARLVPPLLILLPIAATQIPVFRSLCGMIERPAGAIFPVLAVLRADHIYGPAGRAAILIGIIAGIYLALHFARLIPRRFKILNYSLVNAALATHASGRRPSPAGIRIRLITALAGLTLFALFALTLITNDLDGYLHWMATAVPYWYALRPNPFIAGTILSGQGVTHSLLYTPLGGPDRLLHAIITGAKIAVSIGGSGMFLTATIVILANARTIRQNTSRDLETLRRWG